VHDLLFKDTFDECTRFVEGSFMVNGHNETPEVHDNTITFEIETLESCDTITITFEVKVTEECCSCGVEPEKSQVPNVIRPITRFNPVIFGTGVRGATVVVTFANGTQRSTVVGIAGSWSVNSTGLLSGGDVITVVQTESGKEPSDPVVITVL